MGYVKDDDYFFVEKWMIDDLKLSGRELQVYAIIYTATKSEKGYFDGSFNYISAWLGSNRKTAINIIKALINRNLIIKKQIEVDGVKRNLYKAVLPYPKQ